MLIALDGCAQAPDQPVAGQPVLGTAMPTVTGASPSAGASEDHRPEDGFNTQDLVFLQQMIPHDEQALQMAEMALTRAASPDVRAIAEQVEGGPARRGQDDDRFLGPNRGAGRDGRA